MTQSNVISLVKGSVDGQIFVVPAYTHTSVLQNKLRWSWVMYLHKNAHPEMKARVVSRDYEIKC